MNSFDPFREPFDHNVDADLQSQRDLVQPDEPLKQMADAESSNLSTENAPQPRESCEPLHSVVPLPPFSPFVGEERIGDSTMRPQQCLVSEEFSQAVETLSFAVDNELSRLSFLAGKAAQMSDLATLARCKRLVLEMSHFRDLISADLSNMRAIGSQNDHRSAA
jgi:hypothetical protein